MINRNRSQVQGSKVILPLSAGNLESVVLVP